MTLDMARIAVRAGIGMSTAPKACAAAPCEISSCRICSTTARDFKSPAGKLSR